MKQLSLYDIAVAYLSGALFGGGLIWCVGFVVYLAGSVN